MHFPVADVYSQQCIHDHCSTLVRCLKTAHQLMHSHPDAAQQQLDLAHLAYLAALELSRRCGRENAQLYRLYQQLVETQQELDPQASQDHSVALRVAREVLSVHRLHETGDPGMDRVWLQQTQVVLALQTAFRQTACQEMPSECLEGLLGSVGLTSQEAGWVNPVHLGHALHRALRMGRGG